MMFLFVGSLLLYHFCLICDSDNARNVDTRAHLALMCVNLRPTLIIRNAKHTKNSTKDCLTPSYKLKYVISDGSQINTSLPSVFLDELLYN